MGSNAPSDDENFEFNWVKIRKEVGLSDVEAYNPENSSDKFVRKLKENPLVPIGAIVTSVFLTLGLMSMKQGNSKMSQKMMRGRVLAQGFTVAALVAGVYLQASSNFEFADKND